MIESLKQYLNTPFTLLQRSKEKWFLILFGGIFAVFFLSVFTPFNMAEWKYSSPLANKLPIAAFGILGILVLTFSQFGLRSWLNLRSMTIGQFLPLMFTEILLLTLVNFFIFRDADRALLPEFLTVLRHTFLVFLLPYSIALLILALWKSNNSEQQNQSISQPIGEDSIKTIHLKDEKGKIILSLVPERIVLFQADANYVTVFYVAEEKLKKELIRTSLKKIEKEIEDQSFFRLHRSYMVNLNHVSSVNRNKRSYTIQLNKLPELSIPVATSLKPHFEEKMNMR